MSAMKDLAIDIATLYREGYTILAIARQLKVSTKEVQSVINQSKE